MLIQGLVGAAPFLLFAGTNVSKCVLHLLEYLLSGQVKALLGASLAVWNDAAVVKINKFLKIEHLISFMCPQEISWWQEGKRA